MERRLSRFQRCFLLMGCLSALVLFTAGLVAITTRTDTPPLPPPAPPQPAVQETVLRAEPERFPADSYRPDIRESEASGSIDLGSFSPGRKLVYVDDPRVWWESDHDSGDSEDDHTMHAAVEGPLRRLIDLVSAEGGTLKVQDAYRPTGIHNSRSLHKEGRAIDLTCDELGLERLAKLCWVAGFDWVYHEASSRGGSHVHCSMRRGTN